MLANCRWQDAVRLDVSDDENLRFRIIFKTLEFDRMNGIIQNLPFARILGSLILTVLPRVPCASGCFHFATNPRFIQIGIASFQLDQRWRFFCNINW